MSFIQFHTDTHTEVLRLSKDGIWANPDIPADEAAKLVLAAMDLQIKALVDKAVEAEREACAKLCDEQADKLYTSRDSSKCAEYLAEKIRERGNT